MGCVLVGAGGEVLGRGFHPRAGEPHAEIFALLDAGVSVERSGDGQRWMLGGNSEVRGWQRLLSACLCGVVCGRPS